MTGYNIVNGTIRGVANTDLSPELSFYIGYHLAKMIGEKYEDGAKVLVGKDTRISSDMLEGAFSSGVASAGGSTLCVGIIPAPALPYLVGKYKMNSAVMIGGGEAGYETNGFSVFSEDGNELFKKSVKERENLSFATGEKIGRIKRTHTALRDYSDYVKSFAQKSLSGIKIAIDAANGSSFECGKLIFAELGADVEMINNRPDGININLNSGISNTKTISDYVLSHKRDFGIAFSGDADDFKVVSSDGKLIETSCDKDALVCALKTIIGASE